MKYITPDTQSLKIRKSVTLPDTQSLKIKLENQLRVIFLILRLCVSGVMYFTTSTLLKYEHNVSFCHLK